MKVVLLNAPAGSGKDELAHFMATLHKREFKARLYTVAAAIAGIERAHLEMLNQRETKEIACDLLPWNMSPRNWLIYVSEKIIKPTLGEYYFGEAAAADLNAGYNYIFSDSGFMLEAEPVIRAAGIDNVLLVQIERPGHSFMGDSRTYLPVAKFKHVRTIQNTGTLYEFLTTSAEVINSWLN